MRTTIVLCILSVTGCERQTVIPIPNVNKPIAGDKVSNPTRSTINTPIKLQKDDEKIPLVQHMLSVRLDKADVV